MAICDRGGLPIAVHVASASPYEPHLVPATLDARFLPDLPWCLIGDRGYDNDGLDDQTCCRRCGYAAAKDAHHALNVMEAFDRASRHDRRRERRHDEVQLQLLITTRPWIPGIAQHDQPRH